MLPLLLAAAEVTIVDTRDVALRPLVLALAGTALFYLAVRAAVLHAAVGETPAIEFWKASIGMRFWTMLVVAGQWLRLLLWPAHLSAVYSPPEVPVVDGPTWAALPALLACAVGAAIVVIRRRSALAFGILWTAVCLLPTSNVVIPTGVFLAERTLFLPSVGIVIAIAGIVRAPMPRWIAVGALATVLVLGVWRSAIRQTVWHDDAFLFGMTVAEDPRSYAAHFERARALLARGQHDEGLAEAERAEQLYDRDPDLAGLLGREYAAAGRCDAAVPLLRQAVEWMPSRATPRARLARCLQQLGAAGQ
jgi:protein O-mannosyl-transferase